MTDAEYATARMRMLTVKRELWELAAAIGDKYGYCGGEAAGLDLALTILALACDRPQDIPDDAVQDTARREP